MNPKIIRSPEDHEAALARLDVLMDLDPEAGSDEANELELLSFLVEAYEKEKFPISLPSPVDAIKFVMDQRGLSRKDLRPFIGSESKISEVLTGKRPLSLTMIRKLHEGLGIPADVLLQESSCDTIPEEIRA